MRCFIAIDLPEDIKKYLLDTSKFFKIEGLKHIGPQNFHITLKFLGEIDENIVEKIKNKIKDATTSQKQFFCVIKETGTFPNIEKPRVIWVGVESGHQLEDLAKKINKSLATLDFKEESFTSHITIARVKKLDVVVKENVAAALSEAQKIQLKVKEEAQFKVAEMKLVKSTLTPKGPIYETIATFPFVE